MGRLEAGRVFKFELELSYCIGRCTRWKSGRERKMVDVRGENEVELLRHTVLADETKHNS